MTDDPPPKPPTKATAAQLAEGEAKRRAYEERRRAYTNAWHRRLAGLEDEPEPAEKEVLAPEPTRATEPGQQQPGSTGRQRPSRARGRIHNPLQGNLDFDR